jgi:hypothetical protein
MNLPEAQTQAQKYRAIADLDRLATQKELENALPPIVVREVLQGVKDAEEALKLQVLSELYASFLQDPDATAEWLDAVVRTGEIDRQPEIEEDW